MCGDFTKPEAPCAKRPGETPKPQFAGRAPLAARVGSSIIRNSGQVSQTTPQKVIGMPAFFPPPVLAAGSYDEWAVIGLLVVIAAIFAVANIVLSSALGPRRKGRVKDAPYESGMIPAGDTKQRFNVRFYLVAMIFLVFDVEVLFLIPWLTIFPKNSFDNLQHLAGSGDMVVYGVLFGSVLTFIGIILVAYIYAWGKGVLKWD